jgi:predicted flavoprotein YhiN
MKIAKNARRKLMKVIVIGGGPAGMMAAITAKKSNNEVTLLEKNATLGKKLSITGKGRCNITSSLENMDDFIKNTPGNGKFLYSSFRNFTNKDIIKLLNIPTKVERGNRIFPVSDKAQDVVNAFEKQLKGVKIIKDIKVEEILTENIDDNNNNCCNHNFNNNENENNNSKSTIIRAIGVKTNKGNYYADKIILATGGKSYPLTGSTGDGYKMAKKLGHTITEIKPSLVAMTVTKNSLQDCQELQGLTLKNVSIQLIENKKNIYKDFGEMLFTHFGVSGPIILSASSHLVRTKMINPKIIVDMKPALSSEKLEDRILRDFKKYQNKEIKNALNDLLPQKMIPVIIRKSNINFEKKVNEITKEERKQLINSIKNFTIEIEGFRSIDEAIITAGGVSIKEINPKTMESKIVKGLYFAGEIIDVDAYTGGFNLQIAYSTGYTAGLLQ